MRGYIERINKFITVPLAYRLKDYQIITPNFITVLSFLVGGVLASLAIINKQFLIGAILLYIGALLDSLDGDLARIRKSASPEGAILDAVLDRYADFLIILALIISSPNCSLWGYAAILGSFMVPYIRAKTEAVGKKSISTFGSRDVRNFIIFIGLLIQKPCLILKILAIIANISAIHRLIYAIRRKN